ncbi:hypothetical protein GGX14DRAFT_558130 [Mycena pura]|uniref:DUF6534 domain-containing protein n=1 Tax=Mycena pura TaxID=153505 RepID=A0AAD6YMI9_9AGAR|nr:hypothetical protein GGX14DRAFT_558130 [Mycena pura]
MARPALDAITGVLLIGTWVNSVLYTAELIQAFYYFRHFKHDDWKLKTLVTVAFTADTGSILCNYASIYLYTITHAGDSVYLEHQNLPVMVGGFTAIIVAVLVQSFLTVRYWRFTKNITVTLSICLLIIAAFGGAFSVAIIVLLSPTFHNRARLEIPVTTWLATGTAVDICIATSLLWEIRKSHIEGHDRNSLFNRVVAITIQTGTASAAVAIASLMAYLLNGPSNVSLSIVNCLGHVYILSMLSNLNIRTSGNSSPNEVTQLSCATRGAEQGTLHLTTVGATDDSDLSDIRALSIVPLSSSQPSCWVHDIDVHPSVCKSVPAEPSCRDLA